MEDSGPGGPLFSRRSTLALAVVLVVPFAISEVTDAEPYPAIIFPGGANTVRTSDGRVQYGATVLVAFDEQDRPVPLDAADFLEPIPVHYLDAIAGFGFGLTDAGDHTVAVAGVGWSLTASRAEVDEADRDAVRAWLAGRLDDLGYRTDRLVVQQVWITANADDGHEIDREIGEETTIDL
jgi:hypothetical protein